MSGDKGPINREAVDWALSEAFARGPMAALATYGLAGGPATRWYLAHRGRFLDLKAVWRLALFRSEASEEYFEHTTHRARGELTKLGYAAHPLDDLDREFIVREQTGVAAAEIERRWRESIARPMQARFRAELLSMFTTCAISGVEDAAALEAAHIVPKANGGCDDPTNGLLLRTDLHRLFDAGLISVGPDRRVVVAGALTSSTYRKFQGVPLRISVQALAARADRFHERNRFGY